MNWIILLQSTLILFAIVNPIGSIPIFLQLTNRMPQKARQQAFQTAVFTSFAILFLFILAGKGILAIFFRFNWMTSWQQEASYF